jgi:release factor glutamine methyltransferase
MDVVDYFNEAVQKLMPLYTKAEAEELMYWVYEDKLLIKKAHLKLFVKELGVAEEITLNFVLNRLIKGEPIQYILGYAYFMDLALEVNSSVLIPRPETEELVNWCLQLICEKELAIPELNIIDICTGSGCIALALKKKLPEASIDALDISEEAISLVAKNATSLKLPIKLHTNSVFNHIGKATLANHPAQIWISNPPYITETEKEQMHQNVLDFEPHLALFVPNANPLQFYIHILASFLIAAKAEYLFFEISEYQKEALTNILGCQPINFSFKKDLQGKDRMLLISKK